MRSEMTCLGRGIQNRVVISEMLVQRVSLSMWPHLEFWGGVFDIVSLSIL